MKKNKKQVNKTGKNLTTLHTYMSDMADVIRENEVSVIKVALAEQKARERGDYYRQVQGSPKKKILWTIGGVSIILVAIAISYFVIQKAKEKNTPPQIIRAIETPISYDSQVTVDMSNVTNKSDISNVIDPELKIKEMPKSIKAIFINKINNGIVTALSLKDFLSILRVTAPSSLLRSFTGDYMLGYYTPVSAYDKNHLFLIIKISDYNMAYAGMLEWEKTILDNLFSLFHVNVAGENSLLFEKPFKDIVIRNKDARILYTKEGVDILFYLFVNKNTLIITDNQNAIKEIVSRLLVKQTKPL